MPKTIWTIAICLTTGLGPTCRTRPTPAYWRRVRRGPARDDLSPAEDDSVYYIGIHQNRVAVFEGLPAEGRLFRLTDRPVDSLPPREVASLKTGIRISGEREMLEALEGYMR